MSDTPEQHQQPATQSAPPPPKRFGQPTGSAPSAFDYEIVALTAQGRVVTVGIRNKEKKAIDLYARLLLDTQPIPFEHVSIPADNVAEVSFTLAHAFDSEGEGPRFVLIEVAERLIRHKKTQAVIDLAGIKTHVAVVEEVPGQPTSHPPPTASIAGKTSTAYPLSQYALRRIGKRRVL